MDNLKGKLTNEAESGLLMINVNRMQKDELKNETPTFGNVLSVAVTSDDITSLDSRIKSCIVENPDEEMLSNPAKSVMKLNDGDIIFSIIE